MRSRGHSRLCPSASRRRLALALAVLLFGLGARTIVAPLVAVAGSLPAGSSGPEEEENERQQDQDLDLDETRELRLHPQHIRPQLAQPLAVTLPRPPFLERRPSLRWRVLPVAAPRPPPLSSVRLLI